MRTVHPRNHTVRGLRAARLAGVVLAAAMATSLGGCGGSDDTAGSSSTASAPAVDPADVTGTVTWWGWQNAASIKPYQEQLKKRFPNLTVEYKYIEYPNYAASLRTAVVSSSGPDVFALQPGTLTAQYGRFGKDLAGNAQRALGQGWRDSISAQGVTAFTQNGKLVALPVGSGAAGTLLVNKTLLDQAGAAAPKTLDDWIAACAKITKIGKTCFVHGAKDQWANQDVLQVIANSVSPGKFVKAVRGEVPWTDADLVQALSLWKSLFDRNIMQPGATGIAAYPDAMNKWLAGDAAMISMGTWETAEYKADQLKANQKAAGVASPKPFTALLVPYPDVAGKGNPTTLFGDPDYGLAVNTKTDNSTAAEALATYLTTSAEAQQLVADSLVNVPSLKSVQPRPTGLVDDAIQAASLAEVVKSVQDATEPRQIPYADLVTALGDAMSAVATGGKTPQEAAADLQKVSSSIQR